MPRESSQKRRPTPSIARRVIRGVRNAISGTIRLFTPSARGVYPPHVDSLIVLGVALPSDADADELARHLWWRGLGIIERDRQTIAGADITVAVENRRVRQARQFVIKQLRDAGVRGAVMRWEHPILRREQKSGSDKKAKNQATTRTRKRNPKPKT